MKNKIKINFSDFWGGFDKTNNYFYNLLKEEFDVEISNNPDYLLTERIVSYSLSISNNFDMKYTQPSINGQILDDNIGAKFITLTSRTVSGSFTIYSVEPNIITPSYENGITLYFGGPFFYSIPRVNWNMPKVTINPAGGFTHVIIQWRY